MNKLISEVVPICHDETDYDVGEEQASNQDEREDNSITIRMEDEGLMDMGILFQNNQEKIYISFIYLIRMS